MVGLFGLGFGVVLVKNASSIEVEVVKRFKSITLFQKKSRGCDFSGMSSACVISNRLEELFVKFN